MPRNLEQQFQTELDRLKRRQRADWRKKAGLFLLGAIVVGWIYSTRDQVPTQISVPSPVSLTTPTPEPSFPPVAMPQSGAIKPAIESDRSATRIRARALGQLRLFSNPPTPVDRSSIENRCPDGAFLKNNDSYFIKVIDWKSNQIIATAFVRSGEKAILNLPLGTYKLRYATGETWYGEQHYFGTKTQYGEMTNVMTSLPLQLKFDSNGNGWDLGFYRCNSLSNVSTKEINSKDF